jgi:hypothetical protein
MTDQRTSSLSKRQLVVTRTTLPLLFSLILASGCSESTRTEQQKIVSDQPKAEFSLTELKSGEDYRSVRQKLIAQNWIPFQNQDPATCEIFQDRCRDWPETQSCAGSGTSPCRFLWRKGEDHIVVFTNHEIPQFVSYETYKPNSKIAASTDLRSVNFLLNKCLVQNQEHISTRCESRPSSGPALVSQTFESDAFEIKILVAENLKHVVPDKTFSFPASYNILSRDSVEVKVTSPNGCVNLNTYTKMGDKVISKSGAQSGPCNEEQRRSHQIEMRNPESVLFIAS